MPAKSGFPLAGFLDTLQAIHDFVPEFVVGKSAVAKIAHVAHSLLDRLEQGLFFLPEFQKFLLQVADRIVHFGQNSLECVFSGTGGIRGRPEELQFAREVSTQSPV